MPDDGLAQRPDPWGTREPRAWQRAALPLALASIRARRRGVVSAIMGAGKSVLIAAICASGRGRVVVTVPTVALVDQIAATLDERCPGQVGRYYTHAKEADKRVTVCCLPSLPQLVATAGWLPPALWVCDEAHKSECATVLEAHATLAPGASIGFTATPFRTKATEELSLWDTVIYEYGAKQAFADGVVVRPELRLWDGKESECDDVCLAMIRDVLFAGPGLVNASTIADAVFFAGLLVRNGIAAKPMHSQLSRAEQAAVIAKLKAGDLRCIVHVNMLSEGVDMPWLRWLCLRRKVGSRVRFCQEVGRVLRAYDGKDRAYLLDPHDLFDRFGMTYEAVLAGMAYKPPANALDAELDDVPDDTDDGEGVADEEPEVRYAKRLSSFRRYLRILYLAAIGSGVVEQRIKGTSWRRSPPTQKQVDVIRFATAGLSRDTSVPPRHRAKLAEVHDHAGGLYRGDVSDFLSVAFALKEARKANRDIWPLLEAAAKG